MVPASTPNTGLNAPNQPVWPVQPVFKPVQNIGVSVPVHIPRQYIPASTVQYPLPCMQLKVIVTSILIRCSYLMSATFNDEWSVEHYIYPKSLVSSWKEWGKCLIRQASFDIQHDNPLPGRRRTERIKRTFPFKKWGLEKLRETWV